MSKLTKEEVISALEAALSKKEDKAVSIEQKGSWYKIDGGKSMRFSELETMLAELTDAQPATPKAEAKKETKAAPKAKPAAKKAAKKETENVSGGMTPKQLWRAKLAEAKGKATLPRGF